MMEREVFVHAPAAIGARFSVELKGGKSVMLWAGGRREE